MIRNCIPNARITKPKTTFTELSQPPDFGNLFSNAGKKANNVNGNAKANENPNIPTIGFITSPVAASTNNPPTSGAVHENETRTLVTHGASHGTENGVIPARIVPQNNRWTLQVGHSTYGRTNAVDILQSVRLSKRQPHWHGNNANCPRISVWTWLQWLSRPNNRIT